MIIIRYFKVCSKRNKKNKCMYEIIHKSLIFKLVSIGKNFFIQVINNWE